MTNTSLNPNAVRRPAAPDAAALESGRLARLRDAIGSADCDAGVFYDPINIRYATGTSNMQVYSLHNACRYAYVPVEGPVVLFDFKGCEHLSRGHRNVDEVRNAISWYHFVAGPRVDEFAKDWAAEIAALLGSTTARRRRLAVDRLDPAGLRALEPYGVDVVDGQAVADRAKVIKTPEEIEAIRFAMAACDDGITRMRAALQPGITEQELWAAAARRQHRSRWRVVRDAPAHVRTTHQPVVPGVLEQSDPIR